MKIELTPENQARIEEISAQVQELSADAEQLRKIGDRAQHIAKLAEQLAAELELYNEECRGMKGKKYQRIKLDFLSESGPVVATLVALQSNVEAMQANHRKAIELADTMIREASKHLVVAFKQGKTK